MLLDVIEEHLDELDFLWELREASIFRASLRPLHLARLEERMLAHLDGLLEAGAAGVELARAELASESWSRVAAASWVLLRQSVPQIDSVADSLAGAPPDAAAGHRLALRHTEADIWSKRAPRDVQGLPLHVTAAWIDALTYHRRTTDPAALTRLASDSDPSHRARAWAARLRVGPPPSSAELAASAEDESAEVREAALHAAARWSTPGLLELLRAAARRAGDRDAEAIRLLGALGSEPDLVLLRAALESGRAGVAALRGIGALGSPIALPLVIGALEDPELSLTAGDAFEAITGESLRFAAGGTDEPDRPDADEARAIWQRVHKDFSAAERWRRGRPIETLSLREVLTEADLEGARDAYLRVCLASEGRAPDVELETFAKDRGR